ncbi:MAG: ABC transporter ATP-binding protein [Planctomycetota bacterium]|nr:ABC transporter ATP-binding protein [Planctomycetota bacterium]
MIVARDLSKRFGKVLAVDSINFRIRPGRVVGFLGPNGAGKTTTIRMIAGFLPPSAGTVTVDSVDVARRSRAARRRIGYLPESTPLYGEMRVGAYLTFRARLFGIERPGRRAAIEKALDRCRLTDVRRRPIHQLSRGYRQRVGLAAALLHEPPVLILDEPTVGLDPSQIREVRRLIRELAGRHTILLSTHILPEAERTCDEIIMISRGRIRAQGTIDELRGAAARHGRLVLETDSADGERAIRALPGAERVETASLEGGWRRLAIGSDETAGDLREMIAQLAAQRGFAVRELRREAPALEELFLHLVLAEDERGSAGEEGP